MKAKPDTTKAAAIILAAGRSERFGTDNKLLHPVNGEPMIRVTVERILNANLGDVVVVTGHDADQVERALGPRDARHLLVASEEHDGGELLDLVLVVVDAHRDHAVVVGRVRLDEASRVTPRKITLGRLSATGLA